MKTQVLVIPTSINTDEKPPRPRKRVDKESLNSRFTRLPEDDKERLKTIIAKATSESSIARMVDEIFPPVLGGNGNLSYSKNADIAIEEWRSINSKTQTIH